MKFYKLLSLLLLSTLLSCSSDIEVQDTDDSKKNSDYSEWKLNVSTPDDEAFGTRALSASEGLYRFTRNYDKLWYAVYYNNVLVEDEITNSAEAKKTINGKFQLSLMLHKSFDPSKVMVFMWAGNANDNVTTDNVTSVTDGINLNFKERCVSVDPKYLNGGAEIEELDSFAGYIQLATSSTVTNHNITCTLTRPFAQIHILSDEFNYDIIKEYYPDGVKVAAGFGSSEANSRTFSSQMMIPTTWFYDDSKSLSKSYKKGEFMYTYTNYEFVNDTKQEWPYQTTFKNNNYYYLGCLLTFAPESGFMKAAACENSTKKYPYFNVAVRRPGENLNQSHFSSIQIKSSTSAYALAKYRYVIYGSGFVSKNCDFNVSITNTVDGSESIQTN